MKTFISVWLRPAFFIALLFFIFNNTFAQNTKKDKAAKKAAEVKNMIDTQDYIFIAEYVLPMRGGSRYLTSEYDLRVKKDSLIAYLPFFGRAYVAPIDPTEGGIKFTATNFDYKTVEKKDSWDISIKPKDAKDVQTLNLSIFKDGSATLHINSTNREPISYQGYIKAKKPKA